jgi:hypothetical protein
MPWVAQPGDGCRGVGGGGLRTSGSPAPRRSLLHSVKNEPSPRATVCAQISTHLTRLILTFSARLMQQHLLLLPLLRP